MSARFAIAALVLAALNAGLDAQPEKHRMNPVIDLLEQGKPVFGLYAPSNRRGRGAAAADAPVKTPLELARDALAYRGADYLFDGTMEGGLDRGYPAFAELVKGLQDSGTLASSPFAHFTHPLVVKTPKIAPDVVKAADNISRQLNLGVSGIVFVGVESADEVRQGLAAMRFKSQGGTRPEDVATAAAYWGMAESAYKAKADVWPLNAAGELTMWVIVESKEGLAHVREIAAVKGISVLFPGAGTLRGVFSTTNADGQRVLDEQGWEGAIQQVLAACTEFHVPCGYPATVNDIELRMKQGFSVFVINWGDAGFKTVDIGRRVANRPATNQ